MKAQHVWAGAAIVTGIETVSKSNKGGVTMWRKSYPGRISGHAFLLTVIVLTVFTLPVYAVKKNLPAGAILEDEVNTAASGDVLVLDGAPAPINATIPVNKTITIQGYDDNPCEILPTERVVGGQPDTCYDSLTTSLDNPDFEAGDTGWLFTAIPVPPVVPDVSYTPPASADIITDEGEPEEGLWHAIFELDPRGAPVELKYQDPIPTLPQIISEEVRWTTSAANLCNIMDLTTDSTYTLPVLPPTLVENFHADSFPVTLLSNHFHLWLQVLQYSGNPNDKIEVFINNLPVATADGVMLNAWKTAGIWTRWHVTLIPALPAGPVDVRVQVTTRTDVANPTLVLFGAINVNDTVAPGAPSTPDSINLLDYSSNLGAMETYAKSIFDLPALGIVLPPPVDTQTFLARAGGLGAPYIAASIRAMTPVAPGADSITLMFDNHEFGSILLSSLPIVPSPCGRYIFPLPSHLINTPGRPRIRVALTPAGAVTRVLVDDFTLSYVTKALETAYPALAAGSNIIPNGGFEKGNYPFLIESPIATPVNCPHISEVILPTPGACQGGFAAEFKPMLDLLLWVRLPQTSGLLSDQIEAIIVDDGGAETPIGIVNSSTLTVDGATPVGAAWGIVSFPFIPATSDFTVVLRSAIATNMETPSLFLLGAMDIQFGPPVPTALPGPTALKIASLTATDIPTATTIPAAIDPTTDLPPRIFNAPTVAVSGQTHVLRFGGIGTTLKFQAKIMAAPVLGNSTLAVMVDGVEQESILDTALSTNCALQVISPDNFPTETAKADFTFSLMSSILPNPAPFDQTEFFVDNVCLSYCAIGNTIAAQLGLGMPCDRNQLGEGDFEGTPSSKWTVVPVVVPFTDIVQSVESCLGALPNTAAVFKGIQTDVPKYDLALEQAGIIMPLTAPLDLELKFRLNTLKDGGATPGKFTVEVDSVPVFTRSSDAGGTGAYNEYTVNINSVRGMTVPIRFVATIPRSTTPPAFALDHIEICRSGALGGPLFRVTAGGELILKSVTLEQAATGVEVQGGIAKLLQTKMRDLDGTAVTVTGGQAFLASTVLHGNRDNGVHVNGGTAAVLQSTIRDNGGAGVLVDSGAAHIAASLLDNNGQGIVRNAPGTAFSYVNWVQNNDNAATAVATFENINATLVKPQYSDSPWRGKLKTPLFPAPAEPTLGNLVSRVITSSGLPNLGGWANDFECDLRPSFEKAQVGADQVDATPVECPTDSLGADQQPHLPTEPWTSHSSNNAAYVMEQTPNVSYGSVNYITWWGIWLDGGGVPCAPPAGVTVFEIAAYAAPGGPSSDLETVKPVGKPLTGYDYGGATLYKYQHSFDQDVFFRDQYLSVRAIVNVTDNCYFHWISSASGANAATDAAGNPLNVNLSLCISEYTSGDDCAGASFIAQPPVHPMTPWPAAQQSTDVTPVYERVNAGVNSIGVIEFWGIWLSDDSTPAPCTPPITPNLIVKYVNNTDLADAAITAADVITAHGKLFPPETPVAGDAFTAPNGGLAPMYRYVFVPQDDPATGAVDESFIDLNGWLSVQQTGGANGSCRFYWVHSNYGSNNASNWEGPGNTPVNKGVSMSLCLGLTPGGASITGCSVTPAILGKNETGTLELTGTNLYMLQQVALLPQLALPGTPGNPGNLSLHIDLLASPITQSITFSGRLGEPDMKLKIRFRLPGTFNTAADGTTTICTDGRATFETTPSSATTCDILIDTIAPVMLNPGGHAANNASAGGWPLITANRVPPVGMPAMWIPGNPAIGTPMNNVNYATGDMHVYLNAGSQFTIPYALATTPTNPLNVNLSAIFRDPVPYDGANTYPVEISGFVPTVLAVSPHNPFVLPAAPDNVGTARWNGNDPGTLLTGDAVFTPQAVNPAIGQDMMVIWNAQFGPSLMEPWRSAFKLEAVDRAGNETVLDNYNSINLYWLWRTRAKFQAKPDMSLENPEIYWRLDRATADLPDAKPECAPLAFFRLFVVDVSTGALTFAGGCPWRMETLRGSSLFGTVSLQQLLNQYQGSWMCLAVWGADETGNVQYDPGTYSLIADLDAAGVDYHLWMNGERRTPNLAVDTTLRIELFHQKYNIGGRYRNYGAAQRIPLPPLAEACDTRVNASIAMKALVPTADAPIAISNGAVLWKLYKEGALVARGTAPIASDGTTGFDSLMEQLELCTPVASVADLGDYNPDNTFKINLGQRLPWDSFIAYPPVAADYAIPPYTSDEVMDCLSLGVFDFRLGDEGRQPPRANPNMPSQRRREVHYTFTAQAVVLYRYIDPETGVPIEDVIIDATPATNNFSIYVREVEEQLRDETPVREFGR